ncbi:MAG: helix-turn-helix domain-containing protein [Eubacteriales bacterium]|nr:helix-turn-helix domain-containing protein [Eubacteriales bacterium]
MAISYNKLWKLLAERNMSKTELTNKAKISTNAMAKMGKNEDVRLNILEKVCATLDCKLEDVVEFVSNDHEGGK